MALPVRSRSILITNGPFSEIERLLDQFSNVLSQKSYREAKLVAIALLANGSYLDLLRMEAICHFETVLDSPDATPLLDLLVTPDARDGAYGLHVNWINVSPLWFELVLQAYSRALSARGFSSLQISLRLVRDLGELLTYRHFTLERVKILIAKIPEFDPAKDLKGYVDLAKRLNRNVDVITFLESLSPPPPREEPFEVDYTEFCGVSELKGRTNHPYDSLMRRRFLPLDVLKMYQFVGANPVVEGDVPFFRGQVQAYVDQDHLSVKEALVKTRAAYQNTLQDISTVKEILETEEDFEVYGVRELTLDSSISDGRKNIGVTYFMGRTVCKFVSTISRGALTATFKIIRRECEFVRKARKLRETVANVVTVLPYLILNKTENGDIDVGYVMKIEPGDQLRRISTLSPLEKEAIQNQFNTAVREMFHAGYALYDFNDDNVLWDGKKLTLIDLNPAGFDPLALQYADNDDLLYRMSQMLASK